MESINNTGIMQSQNITAVNINSATSNKTIYSAPASPDTQSAIASPASPATPTPTTAGSGGLTPTTTAHVNMPTFPATGAASSANETSTIQNRINYVALRNLAGSSTFNTTTATTAAITSELLSTPKKNTQDAAMLQKIRNKLRSPGGACELQTLRLEVGTEPVNVVKDRYLISTRPSANAATAAKTPASYRHLIDLSTANLKCTDIYTEQEFPCKVINEPLPKVQSSYCLLRQDSLYRSSLYGHTLIRGVHDIIPLSATRTYIIVKPPKQASEIMDIDTEQDLMGNDDCVYEDLHTHIRNRRRLSEAEAVSLFHQICETVQVCHRNGIILRDLKLKRFFFIDAARTKLQYESLEGSMILDNANNDILSDKIGCPLYTAPELLCPQPTYNGKPADMWSLGVILYTMLVGQYPFYEKGNSNLITIIRHCHVQIPASLSRPVRWLLLLLLRKNYEERMTIEQIFHSTWLRDQRPYYMHIPADIVIPDDEEDVANQTTVAANSSQSAISSMETDYIRPLDYSRIALQMECNNTDAMSVSGDVEMG